MQIEWDRPLSHRRGSRTRLGGLDIYYDFDWKTLFRHNRAVFPKGKSLASLVKRECPDGRRATLLLTIREDVEAGIREVGDRYVVVVPIQEYLGQAGADAATTYYARLVGAPLTKLTTLSDAVFSEAELGRFLQDNLDEAVLTEWANATHGNRRLLEDVAGSPPSVQDLSAMIRGLTELNPPEVRELAEHLSEVAGGAGDRSMLEVATSSSTGRYAVGEILADRLEDRIADVRVQLRSYRDLVAQDDVSETDVQRFLEANPWIVGLGYVRARPRVEIPRGEVDFVLERYDGFFDILELKGPRDPVIVEAGPRQPRPPSASSYSLGPGLSKALAQSHLYRSNLDRGRDLTTQYGLSDARQPRVIILAGRSSTLSETGREILRHLNLSLHRVEILPYDRLADRTETWLESIEELLQTPSAKGQQEESAEVGGADGGSIA
jgi:Shedu protein SduA, C-terminal